MGHVAYCLDLYVRAARSGIGRASVIVVRSGRSLSLVGIGASLLIVVDGRFRLARSAKETQHRIGRATARRWWRSRQSSASAPLLSLRHRRLRACVRHRRRTGNAPNPRCGPEARSAARDRSSRCRRTPGVQLSGWKDNVPKWLTNSTSFNVGCRNKNTNDSTSSFSGLRHARRARLRALPKSATWSGRPGSHSTCTPADP